MFEVNKKYYDIKELQYLRKFDHKNVVKYHYKDSDKRFLYIALEWCDETLEEFTTAEGRKDGLHHLEVLWQISKGMVYLHEMQLVHRDLKPSNILMKFQDGYWVAKITDFGISKTLPPDRTKITQSAVSGTEGYMAPEQMTGDKIGKHTDIYSLGLIFHYVLSEGKHAFGCNISEIKKKMWDEDARPDLDAMKDEYKHDAEPLILSMIARKPEKRLCIKDVQAHHLFWTPRKKLSFFAEVSDYIISSDERFKEIQPIFEEKQEEIAANWRQAIHEASAIVGKEMDNMRKKRQGDGICDLLRNIRNLKHHYDEKSEEFRDAIGSMPDDMYHFFKDLFPKLLNHVYEIMTDSKSETRFVEYYTYKEQDEHLWQKSSNRAETQMPSSENVFAQDAREQDEHLRQKLSNRAETPLPSLENVFAQDTPREKAIVPNETVNSCVMKQDSGYQDSSEDEVEKLELRKYQSELAAEALSGSNSLIVAPTGCGKTAVVAGIIQEHLSKQAEGRVMFMVPKTALAHQQYLPYSVGYIIGELAPLAPPGQKMLENKVTVLTAQILINELKRKPEESYISFDKLSMLVFDECHNATKKHPYKQIMDLFLDYAKANPKHPPIQIVGVTASPGVGKAKDRTKVKENLLELLANLDITTPPSLVEKNLDELKKHQNKILEYYFKVQTETEFGNEVMEVMKVAEEQVKKINEKNNAKHLNRVPQDRYKQSYGSWAVGLEKHAKMNMRDQEAARILMTYAEHLQMYNTLLQLKDLVSNAMEHTNKLATFQQEGFENKDLLQKNRELQAKATNIKVPMLDRLLEIIQKEFRKNSDARCIVFVQRKATAKSLEECIAQHKDTSHLHPKFLIGTHDTDIQDAKITKNEQKNVLKAFRDGETKVVIATSVAEEGLDIEKCNLVVVYNHVTGEVGRIQRRGRGRAVDSRAILITPVDSNNLRLEEDNKIRAQATEAAMRDVKKIPPDELEKQIRDLQERQRMERKRKHKISQKATMGELPSKWEIICGKCKNFLTTGDMLRHIQATHIVVKDPKFNSRVIRQVNAQKKGPDIVGTADFVCNNPKCGIKVALEMVHNQSCYPTLSIKKVLMRKEGGKLSDPKKRSNMPFTVTRSIDESDDEEDDENQDALKDATESLGNLSLNDENLPSDDDQKLELLEMMQ